MRTEAEVDRYLVATDSQLTIDLFCFDVDLRIDVEFVSKQARTSINRCVLEFYFCDLCVYILLFF